ncbi:MAG: ABC transporter ATP-binding protein [Asgard group archaeon]|nr:ABC transporter ATP-binding protein [Asgard group archaeon]
MSQDYIIKTDNLERIYGSEENVIKITLNVKKGEIFVLLGPDGSGKTTFFDMLLGLSKPNEGEASILGYNIKNKLELREIKKVVGVLPQEFNTHENLTVKENLLFWGKMYDKMVNLNELLEFTKLTEKEYVRYKKLTPGTKRRVGLATALVNNPQIIFLDEPTSGLDQYAKREVWDIIKALKKEGKTVFITTNQAIESQKVADRVAIIHKGIIKDIGTPQELISRYGTGNKFIIRCPIDIVKQKAIEILQEQYPFSQKDDDIIISSEDATLLEILEKLEKYDIKYSDIITQRPTLNDVFITLTGEVLETDSYED